MNRSACALLAATILFAVSGARGADGPASQPSPKEGAARSVAFFERIMVQDYARVGSLLG